MTRTVLIERAPDWNPHVLWIRYANLPPLVPEQKQRLDLKSEAFRRAIYLNDFSLGRQLGLFPANPSEEEINRDVSSNELESVEK